MTKDIINANHVIRCKAAAIFKDSNVHNLLELINFNAPSKQVSWTLIIHRNNYKTKCHLYVRICPKNCRMDGLESY